MVLHPGLKDGQLRHVDFSSTGAGKGMQKHQIFNDQAGRAATLPGYRVRRRTPSPPVQSDAGFPHTFISLGTGSPGREGCPTCGAIRFRQNGKWVYDARNGDRLNKMPETCQAGWDL